MTKDTFKTLAVASPEALYKEKGSKFYAYAFPIDSEEGINARIKDVKEKHYSARHWCYAWQLGIRNTMYRVNDDGEPRNSAGMPIYGQIQSFGVTNTLVIVVRYFGGIKLGVGGLVKAYKQAANLTLKNAPIIEKTIDVLYTLNFEYVLMNKVMRIIKEHQLEITNQKSALKCLLEIKVRERDAKKIETILNSIFGLEFIKGTSEF
ncbi:IMPACT family protein [Ascidiimonas sp. W6]|uniref:IMPACT family protein n=1 Tax=Ascidiimonas meishanensis TaxID=3128903 RepID=UPI0030ED26C4